MQRTTKPEFEVTTNTQKDKAELFDKMSEGIEIVYREDENKYVGWSDSDDNDDYLIELHKSDKIKIRKRFPQRWAEKDGKLVKVTADNVKEHSEIYKEVPEKFKPKDTETAKEGE